MPFQSFTKIFHVTPLFPLLFRDVLPRKSFFRMEPSTPQKNPTTSQKNERSVNRKADPRTRSETYYVNKGFAQQQSSVAWQERFLMQNIFIAPAVQHGCGAKPWAELNITNNYNFLVTQNSVFILIP